MKWTLRKIDDAPMTERERTLDGLGMTRLREVEKTRGRVTLARNSHQELVDNNETPWQYSYNMWRRFLGKTLTLQEYVLDSPPGDVLTEVEQSALFQIYDRIEIWVPKRSNDFTDRLVVGVIEDDEGNKWYFKIAHWGFPQTSPQDVRTHLRRVEREKRRLAKQKKGGISWGPLVAGGFVAVLIFSSVVFGAVTSSNDDAATPSDSSSEVVEEEPTTPDEVAPPVEPIEEPETTSDESDVEDLVPPLPSGIQDLFGGMTSLVLLLVSGAVILAVFWMIIAWIVRTINRF